MLITPGGGRLVECTYGRGFLDAEILWIGGSVVPVDSVIVWNITDSRTGGWTPEPAGVPG